MPPTNPRVIIADDRQGLYEIVRAALELMGRRPRLIETHTGDDALFELRVSSPDVLIAAHTLPGTTNGPVLALMAKRELAALPILVIGSENDPEMDDDTLDTSPFVYLRRPFAPEVFIRELRIALDGPEAVPQAAEPVDIMGPVPTIDHERLRPIMFQLMRDVGAMAAVMGDRNGKVTIFEGAAGYFDRETLIAALGTTFGATSKMLTVIGDAPRVLTYYDADKLDVYGLAVGLHFFITLAFDATSKDGKRAIGGVNRYGGAAVNAMLEIIGESAYKVRPPAIAQPTPGKPETKEEVRERKRKTRSTQEARAVKIEPEPEPEKLAPIENFDASILDTFDTVNVDEFADLLDPDKLAASASNGNSSRISFEDARLQGIIGDNEE
jgi:CheY-like chemotaxis protein